MPANAPSDDVFAAIAPVRYEGPASANDLAYRYYDKDRIVLGRRMEDHLRFAVCAWHGFVWPGSDVFGAGTFDRPWAVEDPVESAARRREALLAFTAKLGVPFYTWHDVDVSAPIADVADHDRHFGAAVDHLEEAQARYGLRPLWGTANLFSHPRYAAGAATSPDPEVFACGALQVRAAMDATRRLGGANYVLWGGREGYETLLNTDLARELDQLGRFLALAVDHKHRIGFEGAILIEPKPFEPAKHQYDFDVATVYGFLRRYDLAGEVKVNIEANHATLASHSFEHEIATAAALGLLGSIDANRGDPQNGWDTDQFPNSVEELTRAMVEIVRAGGLGSGGFNFDAKVRRQSVDLEDLFHGHIGGIDTVARGLLNAAAVIEDGRVDGARAERYAGWDGTLGRHIMASGTTLADIADAARDEALAPRPRSGRQEWFENRFNRQG